MAARRLLIVMLVLLGLSTLAAALVPPPEEKPVRSGQAQGRESKTTEETGPGASAGPAPRLVRVRMTIGNDPPKIVALRPGDQLELEVGGSVGEDVVIPAFGLTETMTPDAPARFDLIVDRVGDFAVRGVESGIVAGRIRAGEPEPDCSRPPARAGGGSGSACGPRDGP